MSLALELCIRLLAAALIGAVIGYERELRGKSAGVRTHFLVALGACLFMIISQYGFPDAAKFDAARVAAGVVGGLGFLGGGIIMKNKYVSGLTTAAGIWITGAIGLSVGGGMYELGILCTVLVLICMEALHYLNVRQGEHQVSVCLSGRDEKQLVNAIHALGKTVSRFSLSRQGEGFKAEIQLLVKKKDYPQNILATLNALPDVELESMD